MYILAFAVCFFATIAGSLAGIGGGILIKPVLELTGGFTVGALSFLSGLSVLCMASVNLAGASGRAALREPSALQTALGAAAGGVLGKALFQLTGAGARAGLIQAAVLAVLTLLTILYMRAHGRGRVRTLRVRSPLLCAAAGLALGVASAFLGIGGGPINIMALSFLFSLDGARAREHSLLVIFFSQLASLVSALISRSVPAFDWGMLAVMVTAGVLGGLAGGRVRAGMGEDRLSRFFLGLMWGIVLICCVNAARYAGTL